MFRAYLRLIARHFSWLERTFPTFMVPGQYGFRLLVRGLLATPGVIVLIFLPLSLLMVAELSIPVGDGLHLLFIAVTLLTLFGLIIREGLRELKK